MIVRSESWMQGQELAKRNGLIDDYKVMVNTAPAAAMANVVLMSHVPNGAALDPNRERDQRLEAENRKAVPETREKELVAGYDKMRTFVDDGLWQEVKFVK